MAAIELPADYFRVNEGIFSALVQPFNDALGDVHRDAVGVINALTGSDTAAIVERLAVVDGDADVISNAIADEHTSISLTPVDTPLQNYGAADGLTQTSDNARPPENAPGVVWAPPPDPADPTAGAGTGGGQGKDALPISAGGWTRFNPPVDYNRGLDMAVDSAGAHTSSPAGEVGASATNGAIGGPVMPAPAAAPDVPVVAAPVDVAALPVTRAELLELLNHLELTINVQV